MSDTARIIKIDAEIFKVRELLRQGENAALEKLLAELLEKRTEVLKSLDRKARDRVT